MKKLICVFLCLITVLSLFTACKKNKSPEDEAEETVTVQETPAPEQEKNKEITLGYFSGKSLHPYKTDSPLNRSLLTLVYDSLFLVEDGYAVSPLIAESFTNEETKLTVTVKEELYFSDGSLIDPSDVVYSFNIAKDNSFYSKRLSNIKSATASSSSVIFTLGKEDIFAESCLTFPIIKAGDSIEKTPIGSGRYTLGKKDGNYYLKANENTSRKEEMATEKINLVPVSAEKGELYLLQTGDLTYFFDDLSDGDYTKIRANMVKVPLNNLVFISFNREGIFSDENLVSAVNYAIDRTGLCDSVYEGMYRKPKSVFNPDWHIASALDVSENPYNIKQADETLEKSGYVYAYSHNSYRSKNFEFLKVNLLVCSDSKQKTEMAEKIKKSLGQVGINAEIHEKEYSEYIDALKDGGFDLYIGEIKLSANMSLAPFFSSGAGASYGIDKSSVAAKAYSDFAKGAIDISTFTQIFDSTLPFIPLCYRDGMAYFSRELSYEGSVNEYEPFKNIYSWEA
ncbi:MAG: ABC transporter substrate-binding protein [Clostridia bacterium]|nr:ABC transporter substrate-binding protein [Clostridia bacterium]